MLAALINALRVVDKKMGDVKIVVSGVGAAGHAIIQLLQAQGAAHIVGVARKGAIHRGETYTDEHRTWIAENTNDEGFSGTLHEALVGADVFIGVSGPNLFGADQVATMAPGAIVLALANPDPEIHPERGRQARRGGRHRTQRLPQPDQQRARLPRALPRPAGRGRLGHHHADAGGRRRGDRRLRVGRASSTPATSCRASSTLASLLRSPRRSSSRPTPDRTTTTRDTP